MRLIKIYVILFLGTVLVWQPVFSADKYILPVVPFLIIFLCRAVAESTHRTRQCPYPKAISCESPLPGTMQGGRGKRRRVQRVMTWLTTSPLVILFALILLCNFVHIGVMAVKNTTNNIAFIKGNAHAGLSEAQAKFYKEIEKLVHLPPNIIVTSRKPEIVYYLTNLQGRYPWDE